MSFDVRLVNATLVLPDRVVEDASLRIEGGRIAAIDPAWGDGLPEVDLRGALLLPGLIDLHGDLLERELSPRPGVQFPPVFSVAQADRVHAAAGITTAYHALSCGAVPRAEPDPNEQAVRQARDPQAAAAAVRAVRGFAQGGRALVSHRLHLRYELGDAGALAPLMGLVDQGLVDLVSVMDHSPGSAAVRAVMAFVRAATASSSISRVDAHAVARMVPGADQGASERLDRLASSCRGRGIPLASHDDDSAERVQALHHQGVRLCEFPTSLAAAHRAAGLGATVCLGAPNLCRGRSQGGHLRALDALLADAGDVLVSDYNPATLLEAVLLLPELVSMPLHRAVRLATAHPARAMGLVDRGVIEVGRRADLIAVRRDQPPALVEATMVGGRLVHVADPSGRLLAGLLAPW